MLQKLLHNFLQQMSFAKFFLQQRSCCGNCLLRAALAVVAELEEVAVMDTIAPSGRRRRGTAGDDEHGFNDGVPFKDGVRLGGAVRLSVTKTIETAPQTAQPMLPNRFTCHQVG